VRPEPTPDPSLILDLVCLVDGPATIRQLDATARSLTDQTHRGWSAVFAVSSDAHPAARAAAEGWAARDRRFSVSDGAGLPGGEGSHFAIVRAGDVLRPAALEWCASCLPEADLVYTDGATVDPGGEPTDPEFKPAWSPFLLLGTDYLHHLTFVRRELAGSVGWDGDLGRLGRHDLWLRVSETAPIVAHLPNLLLLRRETYTDASGRTLEAEEAGMRVVQAALDRRGWEATAAHGPGTPFRYRILWRPDPEPPLVKVVVPTRDRVELLREALGGLLYRTDDLPIHIVVVDNGSREPETLWYLAELAEHAEVTVVRHDDAFNYSELVNLGARSGPAADLLLLFNNDVVVLHREWLRQLCGWLRVEGVVAAGAKLLFPDGRIQHAGVIVGFGGLAGHYALGEDDLPSPGSLHDAAREVGCVTAACLVVRTEAFEKLDGFDEDLPIDFQDVDFCLRLRHQLGGTIVYDPSYPLTHDQGSTRGSTGASNDYTISRLRFQWHDVLDAGDPYHSPHLPRSRHGGGLEAVARGVDRRRARVAPRWHR